MALAQRLYTAMTFAIIALSAAPSVFAGCEPDKRPVVSLSEELPVADLFENQQGTLGFLEVAYTADDASTGGPITVTNGDDSVEGILGDGQYMYFVGSRCESPALTMDDVRQTEADIGSPLQAKGVVGVTEARVLISEEVPREISLRAAPSEDADVISTMSLYSIVYVHAQHRDPETGTEWYFIGSTSQIRFIDNDQGQLPARITNTLLGWVHEFDIVFWSQRQAAFPIGETASDYAFLDESFAERLIRIPFVDEQDPRRLDPVLKLPVLEINESAGAYRIAIPTIGDSDTAVVADDGRQAIGDVRNAVGFDLLFVLDNSESMEPYREAVLEGVLSASRRLPGFQENRVGIAMFGDYFSSQEDFQNWSNEPPRNGLNPAWIDRMPSGRPIQFWLSDFDAPGTVPSVDDILGEFGDQAYIDPQQDRPEMGLAALQVAVETANWRSGSLRIVFLLGDDNSRDDPSSVLVELLEAENTYLVPINVAGADPNDTFNALWMEQMVALQQELNVIEGNGTSLTPVQSFSLGNDEVAQTADQIDGVVAAAIISREELGGGGQITDLDTIREAAQARADEYGVAASRVLGEVFGALVGGDAEATAERFSQSDTILRAYYPSSDAAIFVALTRREFQAVSSAVEAACIGMANTESMRETIDDMAENLARAFLGEDRDVSLSGVQETLPEYFSQITYLPAEYFSVFGERTLDEFEIWLYQAPDDAYRGVQSELCLSARLMSLIRDGRNGQRNTFIETDFDDFSNLPIFGPSLGELPNFNWLWGNESGIELYFVPQEFFPSDAD